MDVREPFEWDAGHVAGALHVPLAELPGRLATDLPDRSAPLLLYCRSGARSGRAARVPHGQRLRRRRQPQRTDHRLARARRCLGGAGQGAHPRTGASVRAPAAPARDRSRRSAAPGRGEGAHRRRRRAGLARRDLPGRGRGGAHRSRRRRRGGGVEPASPAASFDRAHRHCPRSTRRAWRSTASTPRQRCSAMRDG